MTGKDRCTWEVQSVKEHLYDHSPVICEACAWSSLHCKTTSACISSWTDGVIISITLNTKALSSPPVASKYLSLGSCIQSKLLIPDWCILMTENGLRPLATTGVLLLVSADAAWQWMECFEPMSSSTHVVKSHRATFPSVAIVRATCLMLSVFITDTFKMQRSWKECFPTSLNSLQSAQKPNILWKK